MARILIVDDSPSQLMSIRRIVEKLGHEALTAEDGAAGAEAAAKAGFTQVFNVLEGFEGEIDALQQRGHGDGWRFHHLPWVQD